MATDSRVVRLPSRAEPVEEVEGLELPAQPVDPDDAQPGRLVEAPAEGGQRLFGRRLGDEFRDEGRRPPRAGPRSARPSRRARSGRPPGPWCARSIPARARARLLTQLEWPSAQRMKAGRSGTTSSRSFLCGMLPGKAGYIQPRPWIQPAWGSASTKARIRPWISSTVLAPARSMLARFAEPLTKWTWLSSKPGRTSRPPASMTFVVLRPCGARTSFADPTARMRPSLTATASAQGSAAFTV